MTRKEEDILKKYAKSVKMDPKLVIKVYKKGDSTQREIDIIAIEFTLYLKEQRDKKRIVVEKDGSMKKENQKVYIEITQEFLKDWEERHHKKVPSFFKKSLPMRPLNDLAPEGGAV